MTALDQTAGPTPSAGWTGTSVRLIFGVIWAIDAVLKWLPGYRDSYISSLKQAAQGQPSWLHWWFHFWITLQSGAPSLFATLTGLTETTLALVLLLGVARRVGYTVGAVYALLVWAVGEGFGGPYVSGSTDVGTGIIYSALFITLLVFAPPSRRERLSLDGMLTARWGWWRLGPNLTPWIAFQELRAWSRSSSVGPDLAVRLELAAARAMAHTPGTRRRQTSGPANGRAARGSHLGSTMLRVPAGSPGGPSRFLAEAKRPMRRRPKYPLAAHVAG